MNSFLNQLSHGLYSCPENDYYVQELHNLVNNLSSNVIKHIKIAELQDALAKLGFEFAIDGRGKSDEYVLIDKMCVDTKDDYLYISFYSDFCHFHASTYPNIPYSDPNFHEKVISTVKEISGNSTE